MSEEKKKRDFLDLNNPFFKPLYIRVLVVTLTGLWGLFELLQGNSLWAAAFIGVAGYAGYRFFLDPNRHFGEKSDQTEDDA